MAKAGIEMEDAGARPLVASRDTGTLYVRRVPRDLIGEIKRLAGRKDIEGVRSENDAIVWLLGRAVRSLAAAQFVWACTEPRDGGALAGRDPEFLASEMVVNHYTDVGSGDSGFVMRGRLWTLEREIMSARLFLAHPVGKAYAAGEKGWISPDAGKTLWVVRQVWYTPSGTMVETRMDVKPEKGRLDWAARPWVGQGKGGVVEDGRYEGWGRKASERVRSKRRKETQG